MGTRTTLSAAVDDKTRRVPLTSTTGLNVGDRLEVGREVMLVNRIPVAGTAEVQRGMEGSASQAHVSGEGALFGAPNDSDFERGPGDLANRDAGKVKVYTADGAISHQPGTHVLNAGTALAMTLAAPSVEDDGLRMAITTRTAQAHTITQTTPGFNGGGTTSDVATFSAIGDDVEIVADNGVWLVVGGNITPA